MAEADPKFQSVARDGLTKALADRAAAKRGLSAPNARSQNFHLTDQERFDRYLGLLDADASVSAAHRAQVVVGMPGGAL